MMQQDLHYAMDFPKLWKMLRSVLSRHGNKPTFKPELLLSEMVDGVAQAAPDPRSQLGRAVPKRVTLRINMRDAICDDIALTNFLVEFPHLLAKSWIGQHTGYSSAGSVKWIIESQIDRPVPKIRIAEQLARG
ncbi:hypothetical protein [Devosia soli]|uniref:hypothetical protein n=1 Tax=Devosia soli TaxID=361041 RepID=UPI001FCD55B3|nr:hypothetical protein [Devosia soli]